MGLFDNMLRADEGIICNEDALDFSYQPRVLKHREREQDTVAHAIKPLFRKRSGKNLFIYGKPGIGKTVAVKHVLRVIEDREEELTEGKYDDVYIVYINCWQKNTTDQILKQMCEILGYKPTQNWAMDDLMKIVCGIINKKSVVLVFDEIDKIDDCDFIYNIMEQVYRKTVILITNYIDWLNALDERIKSRLACSIIEFLPYNMMETRDILTQRLAWALNPNVLDDKAFDAIVAICVEMGDIRVGLGIMKGSAMYAEQHNRRYIALNDVQVVIHNSYSNVHKRASTTDEERYSPNLMLSPSTKFSNRKYLGSVIRACKEYIDWFDPYFVKNGLEYLIEEIGDTDVCRIRILSGPKQVNTSLRDFFKRFQDEMLKKHRIQSEFRVIVDKSIHEVHDRWIISHNICYNVPSVNTVERGQYSEIKKTSNRPPFEEWWTNGKDIVNDWNSIAERILLNMDLHS